MGLETDIKRKGEKWKLTFHGKMRTKNNTNEQIIPTHNRDNENCDIEDKREYKVNLDKKYFLTDISCFQQT